MIQRTRRLARGEDSLTVPRVALLSLALFALLSLVLLPNLPNYREVGVGDLAQRDYAAPADTSFESAVLTEQLREQAAAAVKSVFSYEPDIRVEQLVRFDALVAQVDSIRTSTELSVQEKLNTLSSPEGPNVSPQAALFILSFDEATWKAASGAARDTLSELLQTPIPADQVETARAAVPGRITLTESGARQVAAELATPFVVANQVVNEAKTEEERQLAREAVVPVRVNLAKDQVIVKEGQRIDEAALESLEQAGLLASGFEPRELAGLAVMAALAAGFLGWYLLLFRPPALASVRRQLVLLVLITGVVAITRILFPLFLPDTEHRYLHFALPVAAAPMLVASLLETRLAIMVTVLLAVLVSFGAAYAPDGGNISSGGPLEGLRMAMVFLFGGLAGVFGVHRAERFSRYLLAGLAVGLASWLVLAAFWLLEGDDAYEELAWMTAAAGLGGVLSALITLGSFVLLSTVFGLTTRLQLMELAQLNFPLLRRLQDEAPGTFHHSILISSLGERAADLIGADSLLVRVGCYYHDIGKIAQPGYYIENQVEDENPHDHLDPFTSAKIIADHVRIGLELERRYGVPPVVQQFTREHHGTRLVSYFYRKAAERDPDVDPEAFRYPGPRPQSRETAIVMLADSVEATVRATADRSQRAISEVVDTVIGERVAEGQLDDADLTMREIKTIAESFKAGLQAVYHPRIQYPEPTAAEMRQAGLAPPARGDEGGGAGPAGIPLTGDDLAFARGSRGRLPPSLPETDRALPGARPAGARPGPAAAGPRARRDEEPPPAGTQEEAGTDGENGPLPARFKKRLPRSE